MATLAIKGHATRGSEVIGLLEMLGGKNLYFLKGTNAKGNYLIDDGRIICTEIFNLTVFTLEEFLEKFPYKIGDKVTHKGGDLDFTISRMKWVGDKVEYFIDYDAYNGLDAYACDLQPYTEQKEETMEEKKTPKTQEEVNDYLLQHSVKNAMNLLDIEKCLNDDELGLPNGVMIKSDGIGSIEFIRWYEKPQYPKTYGECCKHFGNFATISNNGYKNDLIKNLYKLLICRDAYWKIAGDWKPDWKNGDQFKHSIEVVFDEVGFYDAGGNNLVLVFPTAEMRDAFYENFKELIEECKELL